MNNRLLFYVAAFLVHFSAYAWQPNAWIYTEWPYAYEATSDQWYFLLESGTQWLYTYGPENDSWHRLEDSPLNSGWIRYAWPYANDPVQNDWHYLIQTDTQWTANLTTGEWSQFGQPLSLDPLLTETIYFAVTQPGNLNNDGLAVYDTSHERHLYSVGSRVRAYDPVRDETETVLTLEGQGRPTFLNVRDDELYFIQSENGWLMRYDMADNNLEVLQEARFKYAGRDQSNLHVQLWREGYYNTWVLRRLSMDTNSFGSAKVTAVDNLNLAGSRYWYTPTDESTLMLRDSYTGAGRTDVFKFDSRGFSAVHEMVVDWYSTGQHQPLVGLILEKEGNLGVYLLQVTGPDEGDLNLVAEAKGGTLHSLAFDGNAFYFINGSNPAAIYRVDKESRVVEKVVDVGSSAERINFVNHWLYFGESSSTALKRVHPVSRQVVGLE